MKLAKLLMLLIATSWLGQSCQSEDPTEKIAQETCDCLKPLSELFQKVQKLSEEGMTEELTELVGELESTATEAEACSEKIVKKYGEMDEETITAAMEKNCPSVIETMDMLEEGLE